MKTCTLLLAAAALLVLKNQSNAQNQNGHFPITPFSIENRHEVSSLQRNGGHETDPLPNQTLANVYRPKKRIDSYWDQSIMNWTFNDSVSFTYNTAGHITQALMYDQFGSYSYLYVYSYNSSGLMSQYLRSRWDGFSWVNSTRMTYLYNSNGKMIIFTYQHWDDILIRWVYNYQVNKTYDSNQDQIASVFQIWNDTALVWNDQDRELYTYYPNHQLASKTYQLWNDPVNTWENQSQFQYTYDANGVATGGTNFFWYGMAWQTGYRITDVVWHHWAGNFSNTGNALDSYLEQQWNGADWENAYNIFYTYDVHDNMYNYLDLRWDLNAWVINVEWNDIFSYDVNGNISQDIFQLWNSSTQTVDNYFKSDYSDYQVFTAVPELNSAKSMMEVFPNPSHIAATLKLDENSGIKEIEVYNLLGKLIFSEKVDATIQTLIISRSELPSGIYFIHGINTKNEISGIVKWVVE